MIFFLSVLQNIFLNYKPDPTQCQGNEIFKLYLLINFKYGVFLICVCVCYTLRKKERSKGENVAKKHFLTISKTIVLSVWQGFGKALKNKLTHTGI